MAEEDVEQPDFILGYLATPIIQEEFTIFFPTAYSMTP